MPLGGKGRSLHPNGIGRASMESGVMTKVVSDEICAEMMKVYPEKFVAENEVFSRIHRGDRIFIHTACAEPSIWSRR